MLISGLIAMALQTQTNCDRNWSGGVSCTSGPTIGESIRRREAREDAEARDATVATLKTRMGILVRNNRCEEARNLALEYNEIDLASRAMTLCANSEPAQQGNQPVVIYAPEDVRADSSQERR